MLTKFHLLNLILYVALSGSLLAQNSAPNFLQSLRIDKSDLPRNKIPKQVVSYSSTIEKAKPAVVSITTITNQRTNTYHPLYNPFGNTRSAQRTGLGSGFIVTKDGYILTNNHVVSGADKVIVKIASLKEEYEAEIIGTDPGTDVAVLKINAKTLPTVKLTNSQNSKVGDIVFAIGSPLGFNETVTMGIVSALGRTQTGAPQNEAIPYHDFIQTDASINQGNSGGPLLDALGRVIGINTMIASKSGGNIGIGFAIPANMALRVAEDLIDHGRVRRAYLGVQMNQNFDKAIAESFGLSHNNGVLIDSVEPNSPADKAGLAPGDIILMIEGRKVSDFQRFRLLIGERRPNEMINLIVWRNGISQELDVTLAENQHLKATSKPKKIKRIVKESPPQPGSILAGVTVDDLKPEYRNQLQIPNDMEGALIFEINPASIAAKAGLEPGDLIVKANSKKITSVEDLVSIMETHQGNLRLYIYRKGRGTWLFLKQ